MELKTRTRQFNIGKSKSHTLPFLDYHIGNTPIVPLKENPQIFLKLELFNAFGSIKSRVANAMILDAEKKGILRPNTNQFILEASGGSTGVALCGLGKIKGYGLVCVLPDNYSKTRIKKMSMLGAKVIESDHTKGNDSHFILARNLAKENPDYYYINQLSNNANPKIHYNTTGPEILNQIKSVNYFVCGVGSGGSITGIGKFLKDQNPNVKVIAVQPTGCDVINGKAIPHKIQGLAVGLLPSVFDPSVVDDIISVNYQEALEESIRVFKSDGIFPGISGGANIYATKLLYKKLKSAAENIVTIVPDSGNNYLQENFFEHLK